MDEHDLLAYVDGRLEPGARGRVAAWLTDHPEGAAKVEAWKIQKEELHRLYDGVLHDPLPDQARKSLSEAREQASRLVLRRAVAGVLLFAAGIAGGWVMNDRPDPAETALASLVDRAVGVHMEFSADKPPAMDVSADGEKQRLVDWLSRLLGRAVTPPSGLAGNRFRLVGGRQGTQFGEPAAQLLYEDQAKRRITILIHREEAGRDSEIRIVTRRNVTVCYWIDKPFSFAITGRLEHEDLMKIAIVVYDALEV